MLYTLQVHVYMKTPKDILIKFGLILYLYSDLVLGFRHRTGSEENVNQMSRECQDGCLDGLQLYSCDRECVINYPNPLHQDTCFRQCARSINDCLQNCTPVTNIRMRKWKDTLGLPSF